MRKIAVLAFGFMVWQTATPAQTNDLTDTRQAAASDGGSGVVGENAASSTPEYTPMTASERWRLYFMSTFGPGAIARAVAAALQAAST